MPTPQDHIQNAGAVVAGASVSALLIQGPWKERLIGAAVGGMFAAIAGPIFSPVIFAAIVNLYGELGIDASLLPADAIPPFTGFLLGVFGVDVLTWAKDRVKGLFSTLKFPGFKASKE
jgi:hypothetical protein